MTFSICHDLFMLDISIYHHLCITHGIGFVYFRDRVITRGHTCTYTCVVHHKYKRSRSGMCEGFNTTANYVWITYQQAYIHYFYTRHCFWRLSNIGKVSFKLHTPALCENVLNTTVKSIFFIYFDGSYQPTARLRLPFDFMPNAIAQDTGKNNPFGNLLPITNRTHKGTN